MPLRRLVIGSTNVAKARELRELLAPYGLEVASLADFSAPREVVEDGDSFAANARKKACEQARHLGAWVLADDSGLEVDALGGRPGVYSARYAGESATDEENNARLLAELGELPPPSGHERTVQRLLQDDETPRSQGRIWDAIRLASVITSLGKVVH